jgi:hypothetical protein
VDPAILNGTDLRGALAPALTVSWSANSTSFASLHPGAVIVMTVPTVADDGETSTLKSLGDSRSSKVAGGEVLFVEALVVDSNIEDGTVTSEVDDGCVVVEVVASLPSMLNGAT